MDPKQLVMQCAIQLAGQDPNHVIPKSLRTLRLSQHQKVELQAKSCDALVEREGYTKAQAFRAVQRALAALGSIE